MPSDISVLVGSHISSLTVKRPKAVSNHEAVQERRLLEPSWFETALRASSP